jgi:hypothetical protein
VNEVWVSPIGATPQLQAGAVGVGSEKNPYDGSTPAKLQTLINSVIAEQTLIHLLAGVFHVIELAPKAGHRLVGAGKYATTFLGVSGEGMIRSWGGAHGAQVTDLTMDGGATNAFAVQFFDANDVLVRNVRATNFKNKPVGESFTVAIFAQGMSPVGLLFDHVEIDNYIGGAGGATLLQFGHGGSGDPQHLCTGVIQGCYIHDCPLVQAIGMGARNSVIKGNLVVNCVNGAYWDSWPTINVQVLENFFLNCRHMGIIANGRASGHDDPINSSEGLVIADNVVAINDALESDCCGVGISGSYVKNTQVLRNQVIKNSIFGNWQKGFDLEAPGTVAADNFASPGLVNTWPAKPPPATA